MKLLILGGTSEAAALARLLADDPRFDPTLSLAGATTKPARLPIATRIGGFGGAEGLARVLAKEGFNLVIDATHPFAAVISANARLACDAARLPLAAIRRPGWISAAGDHWISAGNLDQAISLIGADPKRVFLTIGRKEVAAAAKAPHHSYVIRSVDAPPPEALPPDTTLVLARGPFNVAAEEAVLREQAIEVIVTKNSGGDATKAKLDAARALGLPVIMVERPPKPAADIEFTSAAEAYDWLTAPHAGLLAKRGV